jgi:hypothetical protein
MSQRFVLLAGTLALALSQTVAAPAQAPTCAQRPERPAPAAGAQQGGRDPGVPPESPRVPQGTSNVKVLSHIPLPGMANIEVEQDLSRPYAYVSAHRCGFQVIDFKNPTHAQVIYSWNIENPELHVGNALDGRYAKVKGRYLYIQSYEFQTSGPDGPLGASVFDVTSLPDSTKVRETARIYTPEYPRGFHSIYAYKHSNGSSLLMAALPYVGPYTYVYDLTRLMTNKADTAGALIAKIPRPDTASSASMSSKWPGYHDFYVHYDVAKGRDLFYGAGLSGYYIFDITDLQNPKLITRIFGVAGMDVAHTFTPDPTGRYAVTEMEYSSAPLRIFDLKPDGKEEAKLITRPIGAWTPNYHGEPHNHEVRWPYVFVSGYREGLQIFNMMDPTNPYTVGYYRPDGGSMWGVDVRNLDGLIVASDRTGFWLFHLDGFDGWNGHQWGMPNISSVQDWDNGPEGVRKAAKVS